MAVVSFHLPILSIWRFNLSVPREGSIIELSLGDSVLRHKVTQPHDPPAVGGERDRVERGESYVKDFRALQMGTIRLQEGKGTLTLRALKIPQRQALEFRLIMLTRVTQ